MAKNEVVSARQLLRQAFHEALQAKGAGGASFSLEKVEPERQQQRRLTLAHFVAANQSLNNVN